MNLGDNLNRVNAQINKAEENSNRALGSVLLLAVSKQQQVDTINKAYQLGLHHFGESYLQEALQKMKQLGNLAICWHYIGSIQKNKTKGIATHFDWVHSISSIEIARALNEHRPGHYKPLQVCLQINLVNEKTKGGVSIEQAAHLAEEVNQLPHLNLRGLMTIPPLQENMNEQFELFKCLEQLMRSLNEQLNLNMDSLSMGMSDDFVPAIQAGATIVRIGRALFGDRSSTSRS